MAVSEIAATVVLSATMIVEFCKRTDVECYQQYATVLQRGYSLYTSRVV